jgi:hypothetical protein
VLAPEEFSGGGKTVTPIWMDSRFPLDSKTRLLDDHDHIKRIIQDRGANE